MAGRIVQNSLLSAISGGATLFAGFISTILVARLLGVAATGAIAYATWLSMMGVTLLDLGVQSTLARYLPELRRNGEHSVDAFTTSLLRPYLAISVVVILAAGIVAARYADPVLTGVDPRIGVTLIGVLCVLQTLANFTFGELRGRQEFRTAAITALFSLALQTILVAIGALAFGEIGVVIGYCCGAAPMALRALRHLGRRPTKARIALDPRYVRFAAFTWAAGLASAFVWSRSEVFFLQRSWGSEAVALLVAGLTFSSLAAQGPMLLTGALLPFFSEKMSIDRDAVNRAFASGTRILAFLALPLCFGAAGVMPGLIALAFGPRFADASLPGAIVVLASALAAPGAVGNHVMYARDRSDYIFYSALAGGLLSILAGLTIIPRYGLMGAACARAAIQVLLVVCGFWYLQVRLKCPVPLNHLLRLAASAAICGLSARATLDALPKSIALVAAIFAGAVVYFLSVRLLGALHEEDIARLRDMQHRLPRPLRWAATYLASFLSRGAAPLALAK